MITNLPGRFQLKKYVSYLSTLKLRLR